jgi:hypothetical protein
MQQAGKLLQIGLTLLFGPKKRKKPRLFSGAAKVMKWCRL